MKKSISVAVCVLCVAFIVCSMGGCAGKSSKIKVATKATTEGVAVQYAYDKGYFKDEGLDVEVMMFATGAPINEAMAAKEADIAASGNATIFSLATGETTLLAELTSAAGGMGLFARPDSDILTQKGLVEELPDMYGSADTVKGKTFLAALGTSTQLNVQKYANRFGLNKEDVEIIHMDFGPAYQAFVNGEGDVIATIPPYSFDLMRDGNVQIASYVDATGFDACDALFVRNEFLDGNREDVVKFVKAMMRANSDLQDDKLRAEYSIDFFNNNGKSYDNEMMQQEIKVRSYLAKDQYTAGDYVFGKSFYEQGDFFVENGNIEQDKVPNIKKACDPAVLNEALGISVEKPE